MSEQKKATICRSDETGEVFVKWDFVKSVYALLTQQQNYFNSRRKADLVKSKEMENQLRGWIEKVSSKYNLPLS